MISSPESPIDPLVDCLPGDRAELAAAMARGGLRFAPANLVCVSLSAPDVAATIAQRRSEERIILGLATIAQKRQRERTLEAGVHEFLTTVPIDLGQLAARLRLLSVGEALPQQFILDRATGCLTIAGQDHALSEVETAVVGCLLDARGGFVTHDTLLQRGWRGKAAGRQNLRVTINRLRKRIEPEPALPRYLLSEAAIGYRIGSGAPNRPDGTA